MEKYTGLDKQLINGEWRDGSESDVIENLNPYDNSMICTIKGAGTTDVDAAYDAAKEASKAWSKTNPLIRRDPDVTCSGYPDEAEG